jgi:hypothetical protein
MKRLVLVAALAGALAACGDAAEESDEPEATETAAATTEPTPSSSAGTYDVTMPDGTKVTSTLNTDGTYQDADAEGKVTESGTWEDKDGKTCFDPDGEERGVICFTVGDAAEDGSMVATPDDGTDPVTIRKTT